jgi:predicted lipoprotein with Yx(FWY)xxD motif
MRPDLQQDPRPEFGIPVPRDTAGRHADSGAPQAPWSGAQPAAPWSGPTPTAGPYSGPQPAAGPYSGPQPVAPRTGGWPAAGPTARQSAEPTVQQPPAQRYEATAYDAAPAGYEPVGYSPAGYDPRDGHPSGPLPVGSGHRRGTERRSGTGRGRRRALLALVAAGAVVAGAAGYVAIAHWGASSSTAAAPAAAPAAVTSLTGPNLATRETPLGLVATSDGYTVYEYTKDSNKPSAATCTGSCATAWPPVLANDTPWLKGVNPDKVGTVDRPDGTKQMTLNGWPLYRYAKDTKPGDTTGNGVGGTWKALNPEGKAVAASAPAAGGSAPAPAAPAPAAPAPAAKQGGADADGDGDGTGGAASGGSYSSGGGY